MLFLQFIKASKRIKGITYSDIEKYKERKIVRKRERERDNLLGRDRDIDIRDIARGGLLQAQLVYRKET